MKYILLTALIFLVSCGYKIIPESEYEVDTTSPYVIGVTWNGNNKFDISRKTNSSFDAILDVSDEEAEVKGKNYNVAVNPEIVVTFSENMYPDSLFQYGVSESVVIIEGEPSRSFLTDIASPPLTDTNVAKILKVKVKMLSENNQKELLLDFGDAEDCQSEEDFKNKYCKLKKDTNYTLVISKKVVNENGRTLVVKKDDGKFISENFVLLFRTTGTPPQIISTEPQDGERDICLNLQKVKVNFSTDMDKFSINEDSFYLSANGNKYTDSDMEITSRQAVLNLHSPLSANTTYKINLTSQIRSRSRVNIEEASFSFTTSSSVSNQGPQFISGPTATVNGNTITVTWKTDTKSMADIKYGKGALSHSFDYNEYKTDHSVTIDANDGPGNYIVSISPKDRCGNTTSPQTVNATILNHPLISEVSPNPSSQDNEFVELYNDGDESIDLSSYSLFIGTDEINLSGTLEAKSYALIMDENYNIQINSSALLITASIDMTKSEPVYLKNNGSNVDSYTYSFKATASSNLSAQRRVVTLRNSDSSNYCEAPPTPGSVNNCQ